MCCGVWKANETAVEQLPMTPWHCCAAMLGLCARVPAVKARVRSLLLSECKETARQALDTADGAEVRTLVARRHT